MALTINTNIINDVDGYLLDAKNVKGGYVVVSGRGSDTKENLYAATKVVGTLVYDAYEGKSYRWDGNVWIEEQGGSAGGVSESQIRNLLAGLGLDGHSLNQEIVNNVAKNMIALDGYSIVDPTEVDEEGNPVAELVISNIYTNEEAGITNGHLFNDIQNTIYLAGNTKNPKYVTTDDSGNIKIEDIALKSDIKTSEDWPVPQIVFTAEQIDFRFDDSGNLTYMGFKNITDEQDAILSDLRYSAINVDATVAGLPKGDVYRNGDVPDGFAFLLDLISGSGSAISNTKMMAVYDQPSRTVSLEMFAIATENYVEQRLTDHVTDPNVLHVTQAEKDLWNSTHGALVWGQLGTND